MLPEMHRAPQELRTYFVTTVTAERRRLFRVHATAELMLAHLQENRERHRFELHAFVLMPDHIHLMLTPAPDISLEKAMQFIKGGFSFKLKSKLDVWQRGYNEVQIRTAEKFEVCKVYIEMNPVRRCLVEEPALFPFSSAGRIGMIDPRPAWFGNGEQIT